MQIQQQLATDLSLGLTVPVGSGVGGGVSLDRVDTYDRCGLRHLQNSAA